LTGLGNPGDFRTETLNVILLFVKSCFCHEHGEITILNSKLLDSAVEEFCNLLPNEK
jgi:hypothetical protein